MAKRIRLLTALVIGVTLAYAFWWFAIRPPGPDEVAAMAATALSKRDVATLLRLTSPEEKRQLNLTPYNVTAVLNDTLYAHGPLGRLGVRQVADYPVDEPTYLLVPLDRHDFPGSLRIRVSQQPNGRWYLPLGYTLLVAYAATGHFQDSWERHVKYIREAGQYGIRGVRLNQSGYQWFRDNLNPAPR